MRFMNRVSVVSIIIALFVFGTPLEAFAASDVAPSHAFGVGLTLSFSMGARPAFGLGVDLRYTLLILEPRWNEVSYGTIGAFVQATSLRGGAFRFAGGAHGGALVDDWILNTDGELGVTYRTAFTEPDAATTSADERPQTTAPRKYDPGGWGLHLGFSPQFNLLLLEHGPILRLSLGFAKETKNEAILGWEFRALPAYSFGRTGSRGHWF